MSDVSTLTTQTSVSAAPPASQQTYDLQGVAVLVGVVFMFMLTASNGLGDLFSKFKGIKKGRAEEENKLIAPLERRVVDLEVNARTFRSSEYLDREFNRIEMKIDHNKNNTSACLDQLTNMNRGVASDLGEAQRGIIRLEQSIKNVEGNFSRVENAVDKLSVRIEERMDKFQEVLATRSSH